MGRKKKFYAITDVKAPKTRDVHFRVNTKEMIDLDKITHKTGLSKSDIFREAIKDYYNKVFSEE